MVDVSPITLPGFARFDHHPSGFYASSTVLLLLGLGSVLPILAFVVPLLRIFVARATHLVMFPEPTVDGLI